MHISYALCLDREKEISMESKPGQWVHPVPAKQCCLASSTVEYICVSVLAEQKYEKIVIFVDVARKLTNLGTEHSPFKMFLKIWLDDGSFIINAMPWGLINASIALQWGHQCSPL